MAFQIDFYQGRQFTSMWQGFRFLSKLKIRRMRKILICVAILNLTFFSSCFAADVAEPKWLGLGFGVINLDQVVKIEVEGDVLTLIGKDKTIIAQIPNTKKDCITRLRTLIHQSPNWVDASNSRDENQEWYVNLENVALIGSFDFLPDHTKRATFSWKLGDVMCVASSDDATLKTRTFFAQRGFKID